MQNTRSFLKGIATGAAIGIGMTMIINPMERKDVRKVQRNTGRMFTTVGSVLDNIFTNMQ